MIAVRLKPEMEARLARMARKTGRTKTYYVREALIEHLEHIEDVVLMIVTFQYPIVIEYELVQFVPYLNQQVVDHPKQML